jgi:hypothetical protein
MLNDEIKIKKNRKKKEEKNIIEVNGVLWWVVQ